MGRASRLLAALGDILFITEGEPSIRKGLINGLLVYVYVAAFCILTGRFLLLVGPVS